MSGPGRAKLGQIEKENDDDHENVHAVYPKSQDHFFFFFIKPQDLCPKSEHLHILS